MKFSLKDFIELDTTALLAVNGGSDCSSASSSYYVTSSSNSNGQGSSVTSSEYESYRSNYGGLSGTSSCGSVSTNVITKDGGTVIKPSTTKSEEETPTVDGYCSSIATDNRIEKDENNTRDINAEDTNLKHQIPLDYNDFHCDINSFNVAVDEGILNPGLWDGNELSVNEIYIDNYKNLSTDMPLEGTRGYGFYDNDGNGSYDHMYYYDYTKGGECYDIWNSDGIQDVKKTTWSIYGTAVKSSVYVPLK